MTLQNILLLLLLPCYALVHTFMITKQLTMGYWSTYVSIMNCPNPIVLFCSLLSGCHSIYFSSCHCSCKSAVILAMVIIYQGASHSQFFITATFPGFLFQLLFQLLVQLSLQLSVRCYFRPHNMHQLVRPEGCLGHRVSNP